MKFNIDPMRNAREAKKTAINRAFAQRATEDLHRDLAHAQKLQWAKSLDDRLKPEADLRGISVAELADMIKAKASDAVADRELARQQIMARIEAAKTPADLDAI